MKIEKLKMLNQELIKEMSIEGVSCTIHYKSDTDWHDLDNQEHPSESTTLVLEKSKSELVAYHTSNSPTAWFHLPALDITISLTFSKSPQINTRKKFREKIERIQESSSNAYKVSHHSLTHLLAKDAFREALLSEILNLDNESGTSEEAQEIDQPKTLATLALDIDYFKQVNDTWGHLYGDQVLKVFGKRLENAANKIKKNSSGAPTIYLGHPSGEEFLVLIVANATREQFSIWGNEFRSVISDDILPTDEEWSWLCKCDNLTALSPPPMQDRSISTSIGIALHTSITQLDITEDPSSSLLDRADTALYRAKAAGRNQVIFYDEILASCGRVLEQNPETKIIAIDIGSNVGVTIGQEFKVFSPTFTGRQKFTINDGRTTRTLGTYPRVESARIIVFNTQPEISFAYIDNTEQANTDIELGSHLEAIPAGSIGHLLPNSSKYFPASQDALRGGGVHELQEFIKTSATAKTQLFAVVIRFKREPEYLRKYGTAALNIALARLYRAAQVSFHAAHSVEVLDRSSVCVAGTMKGYNEDITVKFVNDMAEEFPELGLVAGIFNDDDLKSIKKERKLDLNSENSIEFARFAASELGWEADARARHFSHATAFKVLQALREARSFEVAYADFTRLINLGIDTASIFNLGGLIAGGLGWKRKAFEYYESAITKDPSSIIFRTNFGTACYALDEVESALKVLNTLTDENIDKLPDQHAFGYLTYTALLAKAKNTNSTLHISERFTRMAATALKLPIAENSPAAEIIRQALNT